MAPELARPSAPGPVSPPKVAAVSEPKLTAPAPLLSSVLCCKAPELARTSVPLLTRVLPL